MSSEHSPQPHDWCQYLIQEACWNLFFQLQHQYTIPERVLTEYQISSALYFQTLQSTSEYCHPVFTSHPFCGNVSQSHTLKNQWGPLRVSDSVDYINTYHIWRVKVRIKKKIQNISHQSNATLHAVWLPGAPLLTHAHRNQKDDTVLVVFGKQFKL